MPPGAEFAWQAFWRLHGDRGYVSVTSKIIEAGMGGIGTVDARPCRIPFSSIDLYASRYEIEGEAFDLFIALIEVLDREFLAVEAEKARERASKR